jgi:hypothetical protein
LVGFKQCEPRFVQALAPPAHAPLKMLAYTVRHEKLGIFGPAVASLGEPYFFLAEWLAMGCAGVLFVRRTIADVAFDDNERWRVLGSAKNLYRLAQPF